MDTFDEKTGAVKSRATVPLSTIYSVYYLKFFSEETPSWCLVDLQLSFSPQKRLLLQALVTTEKLPPHLMMTSLADIQDQDNCREKVISLQNFLQGPCSYGQRRLCLALCILSSLYATRPSRPPVQCTLYIEHITQILKQLLSPKFQSFNGG